MATKHQRAGTQERIQQRREKVMALRVAGASERAIAKQVGVSNAQVHHDLVYMMALSARETKQSADHHRALELERLDKLLLACWGEATAPNADGRNSSIDRALNISARRAKMLGLDAPIDIRAEYVFTITVEQAAVLERHKLTAGEAMEMLIHQLAQVENE